MKKKIVNNFIAGLVLILLVAAIAAKIYSFLTFPEISDWNYHQIQNIDKTKNEFSFAVFGDSKNSMTTFRHLITMINKEDIKFAIDVGDLVYDGEKEKFRFFFKQAEHLNKPCLTAIGNHEAKEGGRSNYYELFGKFYYSFSVGNVYFIVLDDSNEKNLDFRQADWLKEELKKSIKYQYRFIFMHVPLFDPRKTNQPGHSLKDVKFAKELNFLFDQHDVTMLFVSHIHGYFRGVWGKTPYIVTGGAGAEMFKTDPKHYFYHYIKVSLTNEGPKYQVVKLKSPDFDFVGRIICGIWIYIMSFFVIHFLDLILISSFCCLTYFIIIRFMRN